MGLRSLNFGAALVCSRRVLGIVVCAFRALRFISCAVKVASPDI